MSLRSSHFAHAIGAMAHEQIRDRDYRGVHVDSAVAGLEFVGCVVRGCSLGAGVRRVDQRFTLADTIVRDCRVVSAVIGPIVLDGIHVDGLRTDTHLRFPACAFRHCVLRGSIGKIVVYETALLTEPLVSSTNRAFVEANKAFYAAGNWALDISGAAFEELDIRGVPAELIKIDPQRQIRVSYARTRAAFDEGHLNGVISGYAHSLVGASLKHRHESQADFVLATNDAHPHSDEMHALFAVLGAGGMVV